MTNILSDDIGSYPLPKGVDRTWANETGLKIASGESSAEEKEKFYKIVAEIMSQKIKSGISNPNYPQVRDMISSFFGLMEKFQSDEPWVVPKENAVIPEIDAIQEVAKRHHEETKTRLNLRVCVTGPLDLYIANAGTTIDGELLKNLGKSVSGFI